MSSIPSFPDAIDPSAVGTFPATAKAGGGYVWDEVLEYRVWCHPENGAPDEADGNDYFLPFAIYEDALQFARATPGSEEPLALIRQKEYISEEEPGDYRHVKDVRVAEWPVEYLLRPRRTPNTIPEFLSPDARPHRLDILRGLVRPDS